MRGRQLRGPALAVVALMAFTACGGDQAGEATAGETAETETGAAAQPQQESPQQMAVNLPEGVTQEQYQQGRQLFTGQGACHACHGPQATGTQLAPDLTDDTWLNVSGRNYDEIGDLIHTGVPQPVEHPGPMPPMGGASLTDEQVNNLAAYVVGLGQG